MISRERCRSLEVVPVRVVFGGKGYYQLAVEEGLAYKAVNYPHSVGKMVIWEREDSGQLLGDRLVDVEFLLVG
jgi:hypothetical protein